jgi:hypothetical protein
MTLEYIETVTFSDTGGHSIVDFVILKDGRVLGINDECVCLYQSMDAFWNGPNENVQCIELREINS